MKQFLTRYYLWLAGLPVIGGAIHIIVHTFSHIMGYGCP